MPNTIFSVQQHQHEMQNRAVRLAQSLTNFVQLHIETPQAKPLEYTTWNMLHKANEATPISSPRRKYQQNGVKSMVFNRHSFFDKVGLGNTGYNVSKYIYAMSHVDVPNWLERSHLVDTWSKDSNWMGFVAVSDDEESHRIGRRDIVVSWRGTVAPSEWFKDLERNLEPLGDGEVKVEHGFHHLYTCKSEFTRYNKSSASEQVMQEVIRLVNLYRNRGEEVSLTITGHSLGGALALLNAYEAATSIPDLPINVISFGAPRVGNAAFRDELDQMGVKTLRVVVKQDVVPRMPGVMFNEGLEKFEEITGELDWVYTHVGS
ncbi:hypothetical protein IFM89_018535 [Coptis chinensis]|uniref:Fungal lipase-type domain-containing protein n=1 Tax=Coptis chinensis TaxID=261450 RepID=A0A835HWT5_9MAGN|nr:hypothetical protein IFM89_018535 [Coptis chinensis]